jgi:diketogulonate reductase-like aldo/keto reductase
LPREVSVIGQGTWYIDEGDRAAAIAALRRGLDLGMNHIDTAEMYGAGAAEEMVGMAIAGRRDEVFLASKVLPQNASRLGTRIACERSLMHLKTDRLDCYLLHWRGPHPLEDSFAAFEALRDEGKILSYGVSNFDVPDLVEAREIAGEGAIACNQVLYHLQERAIEHAVLPWCELHGVAVTAYSPFGHGDFPSKHTAGGRDPAPDRARISHAAAFGLRNPQSLQCRPCRRECRRVWRAFVEARDRPDRRGVPARTASRRTTDALVDHPRGAAFGSGALPGCPIERRAGT